MEEEVRRRKGDEEEKNKIKRTRQPKEKRAQCYIKRTKKGNRHTPPPEKASI
jgi:hypothetical protein